MKIFPIVHIENNGVNTAAHEGIRALELGADGIYLTDHYNGAKDTKPLFETYQRVLYEAPERYVGINIFGLGPADSMRSLAGLLNNAKDFIQPSSPSGLLVDEMRHDGPRKLDAIELRNLDPKLQSVRLLGGVAFRHTSTYTDNPTMAAYETEWLKDSVDVVVTSGESSSKQPSIEKLMAMKEATGDKPLAITSELSTENIRQYEWIVDEVLVSRKIETLYGIDTFDRHNLEELVRLAHSLAD